VTLSQIVHLRARPRIEPSLTLKPAFDANFDNQRRLDCYATDPPTSVGVMRDPHGSVFRQPQQDRVSFFTTRMSVTKRVAQWALIAGWALKEKDGLAKRYQGPPNEFAEKRPSKATAAVRSLRPQPKSGEAEKEGRKKF